MSDDESTQPIDLEALRAANKATDPPEKPEVPPEEVDADEAVPVPVQTAETDVALSHGRTTENAAGPGEHPPAASAIASSNFHPSTVSVTRQLMHQPTTQSITATLSRLEPPTRRGATLPATDAGENGAATDDLSVEPASVTRFDAPAPPAHVTDEVPIGDAPVEEGETQTQLPLSARDTAPPRPPAFAFDDVETTSVSRGSAIPPSLDRHLPPDTTSEPVVDTTHEHPPATVHEEALDARLSALHPADAPDVTHMRERSGPEIQAAFAHAAAQEPTAIFEGPVPTNAMPSIMRAPEPPPATIEEEIADEHLVDDAEVELVHDPHALTSDSPRPYDSASLPRFELSDGLSDEIAPLSADDETRVPGKYTRGRADSASDASFTPRAPGPGSASAQIVSGSSPSVEIVSSPASPHAPPIDPVESWDDDEHTRSRMRPSEPEELRPRPFGEDAPPTEPPAGRERAPAPTTSVVPARLGPSQQPYHPPAPVARRTGPAYAIDPDRDELQLQDEGGWRALLELYRARVAEAYTPLDRAPILVKIASVHEHALGEPQQAFEILVEAFDMRPADDDVVSALDRVAKEVGRVGELAERARRNLHTADHELRVILLGHLVYWYERVLHRAQEASPFVSELERLDKTHPVALRRAAQLAGASGDVKTQRELLLRALDRTRRTDEKVQMYLALANAHGGTPEQARHYESALALDPTCLPALQGIERLGREQEKHAQVKWALERQADCAPTDAERAAALLKLADLLDSKFLKREAAAEILERVLDLEPQNPQALKSLERCYHALRDWPRLAKILRARAENTYDKRQKVELLELAAEVLESKIGDSAAAVEVKRDVLIVDPKHRRALGDLARLYEKLGDWANVATYKSRLAELAPSKRLASQELVKLGDFLSHPDRDLIAARLQYERSVTIDPTNATAWEALQRLAAAAGDDRRVVQCLEHRAKYVDGPRQRAAIYVELAGMLRAQGDERGARDAFEGAVKNEPSNEVAATAMLDVYTREEKWKEAAPLCELLVNAAVRDHDATALFTRLRLATRIAAALGDAERAMSSALGALDAQPDDPGAQADLVAVASQCTKSAPHVVARAKDRLAAIATGPILLPADVLVRLAQVQREGRDLDAAAATLERALEHDGDAPAVLKELSDVYLAQHDFPRACKLKRDMARNATSADARFDLLVETGEIWARQAKELEQAATVFEEARKIKPLDHWLLHTLMWLYGELGEWDRLFGVLEGITHIQESPDRKVKSLVAMAEVVREKVGDRRRAADLYDKALDIDRKRLDCFEALVRSLTEEKDWQALERAYRKMIARVKGEGETQLEFALFHQLGLIYRDRLENAELAFEALDAASRIKPSDPEVRKIVTELLVVTDNLDAAVARTRELIELDPHDAELYAELYELFLRQRYFDKAWCAINVLARIREPTPEQRRFHEDYPPFPLHEVPGQIVDQAWHSHILHFDLDPNLTSLFALMTPAVARMRHAQLRPEQLVYAVGRPFTPAHSRLYEPIRAIFGNAAEILGLSRPELLLGDPKYPQPFAASLHPFGAILVCVPAVEARADALVYMIGKRLAEQRRELAARAFFPSVPDLAGLLAAAVRIGRQEGAQDAAGAALDASFSSVLTPQEREGIKNLVMQVTMDGGIVDVKRWSQAADLSSMRAGLLLCGDVEPARKTILAEPQSAADLTPREKIGELYKFATSDLYSDLRGAIGVAVEG